MLPLALKVALSEENSSVLVHYKNRPRGGRGLGVRTCRSRYWPVIRLGIDGKVWSHGSLSKFAIISQREEEFPPMNITYSYTQRKAFVAHLIKKVGFLWQKVKEIIL